MDDITHWLTDPTDAYRRWQHTEATGADRRAFSSRSIIQHEAMFERFMRHLAAAQKSLATFGPEHLESFFADVDNRCQPGTSTRLRYQKLIDRLCRHLIAAGVRQSNPAAAFAPNEQWPDDPEPVFLSDTDDRRLQARIADAHALDGRALRNRAIVGLLLATGITALEIRTAKADALDLSPFYPRLDIPKRPARDARRVPIGAFAVPALTRWFDHRQPSDSPLLFPSPRGGRSMTDAMLGLIVRDELLAVDVRVPDMSPRTLRNTYARRSLMNGGTNDGVSALLGLTTHRTVVAIRTTIPARDDEAA